MSFKIVLGASDHISSVQREFNIVIDDWARQVFKIESDELIKNGVAKYFGDRPTHIFLKSPTTWSDLYKTNHRDQVNTTLRAEIGKEFSLTNQKEMIVAKTFYNQSDSTKTSSGILTHGITKSVQASWNWTGTSGPNYETPILVDLIIPGINVSTTYGKTGSTSASASSNIKDSTGVSVELRPGQRVRVEIICTKTKGTTQIHFDSKLDGFIACNYAGKYQEYHVWRIPVAHVMSALGLATIRRASMDVNTVYYRNTRVVFTDIDTGKSASVPITNNQIFFRASQL